MRLHANAMLRNLSKARLFTKLTLIAQNNESNAWQNKILPSMIRELFVYNDENVVELK